MPPEDLRPDLIAPSVPTAWLIVALIATAIAWSGGHRLRSTSAGTAARPALAALRFAAGSACLWLAAQLFARAVHLATPWPLWAVAALGAAGVEACAALSRGSRALAGRRGSALLGALRSGAVLGLTAMLLQPVWSREAEREMQRELVVLIDDSMSMALADQGLTISEKLRVAALLGVEPAARPGTLSAIERDLALLEKRLVIEAGALQPPEGVSATAADALIARRAPDLRAVLERGAREAASLADAVGRERARHPDLSGPTAQLLSDYDVRIRDGIAAELGRAAGEVARGAYPDARGRLHGVGRQLRFVLEKLPAAAAETDRLFYDALPAPERERIDAAATATRAAIAREILRRPPAGDAAQDPRASLAEALAAGYRVRFIRFAEGAAEMDGGRWLAGSGAEAAEEAFAEAATAAFAEAATTAASEAPAGEAPATGPAAPGGFRSRDRTDLAAAFDAVLERVPTADLAGVLVIGDGRHNGDRAAEEGARRLGLAGVPVCAVAVGSSVGPRDAAVLAVRAPDSIYQDDLAVVQADLKLDGLLGETLQVDLKQGGRVIDSETVEVQSMADRPTVRFSHTPEDIGIFDYEVAVHAVAGEAFRDNNRWGFQVAVTDDRTDVLLVDSYPRWEFRYLRNLFYARDKSVHLQHLLLAPDRIDGAPPPPLIPASAGRRFGEAEATALPSGREEWLRFDAFILGDLPPAALSPEDWEALRYAVAERGALLVVIAGQRWMPHAHDAPALLEMLPTAPRRSPAPPGAYRLRIAQAGRSHLAMRQADDPAVSAMVWGGLPPLYWRHAAGEPKPAAEVLAYAEPVSGALAEAARGGFGTREEQLRAESEGALIVSGRYALGRVMQVNFDATWRLRYGVGDTFHHQFWGQVLRWGTGENLRAGNDLIRLGTDRLSYAPGGRVKALAKVLDEGHQPVEDGEVSVAIYARDALLLRRALTYRSGSNGIYEGELEAPEEPGRYRVVLEGAEVSRVLGAGGSAAVETELIVNPASNAVELAELTADRAALGQLAALAEGAVADPDNAASLLPFFLDPGRVVSETRERPLWDHPLLLLPILLLLGIEWAVRRNAGIP